MASQPSRRARALALPVIGKSLASVPVRPSAQAIPARAKAVLQAIEANPGLTVFEYCQTTNENATMINAILAHTEIGKWVAQTGKVALPLTGVTPSWYVGMPEQYKNNVPVSKTVPVPRRPRPQVVTTRAKEILDYIEAHPGYTVMEYSDLMTRSRESITAVLTRTKLGQYLCMTGKVALPSVGARPEWLDKVPEELQPSIPVRTPEPQLSLTLPKAIKGKLASAWNEFGDDLVAMLCRNTISPHVRLQRLEILAAHIEGGLEREMAAQKTIKKLLLSVKDEPKPMLALPAPAPKTKAKRPSKKTTAKLAA